MVIPSQLSRRERQIMDILFRLEKASVREVQEQMTDPPGYSSVRTLLTKLVEKGHVAHSESGLKYVYYPLQDRNQASRSALKNIVRTFFQDSHYSAVNSLLDISTNELTDDELLELEQIIRKKKDSRRIEE